MIRPPQWPATILRWLCDPELFDEIIGDMDEMFAMWVRMYGEKKARRMYVLHMIKFLRPFIFKKRTKYSNAMTLNYTKVAWRNISRNKAFALINVVGLSLGLTCAIVIYTLVTYHRSFDTFHPDTEHTYRMVFEFHGEQLETMEWVPQPLGKAFKNDFAFADKVARIRGYRNVIVSLPEEPDNKKFEEKSAVAFVESAFFELFNFPTISGSASAISDPNTALITRSSARKYFDTEDVVGKLIRINMQGTQVDFHIAGVLEDTPENTQFRRQVYLSYQNLKDYNPYYASDESWGSVNSGMECFVRLNPGVTRQQVDAALPELVKKYYDDVDEKMHVFKLQPVSEMHFDPRFGGSFSMRNMWTLIIVGFFLVVIACINFINLATAQVLNRSKEVGVRKILGSRRRYIFTQFIVETGMVALFSLIVAGTLTYMSLPFVNSTLGERLSIHFFDQWQLPVFVLGTLAFVVFVSGVYPALTMTRFQPVRVLKGNITPGKSFSMRRVLIIAQFAVSQVLIISMIVIHTQMQYSVNADLGFEKDAVIMMPIPNRDRTKMKTLAARVEQVPGVRDISLCFESPASSSNAFTNARFGDRTQDEVWEINLREADENYIPVFDLKLVAGRNLLRADSARELLVNETFVRKVGMASPEEAIGKRLSINGGTVSGTIEGVVKDFHMESFHNPITPMAIYIDYNRYRNLAIKINMSDAQTAINDFTRIWNETYPENIFAYEFLDDRIASFYESDNAMLRLVETVAAIAIIISCLGLYGLVAFMAVRKTKEIGVRKVLGASVPSILWLFGKEFVLLILVAFVAAAPLAWLAMDRWLEGFVYRIDVSPLSFVLAIGCTIVIAAITVSYHSVRSALANPARSLRTE